MKYLSDIVTLNDNFRRTININSDSDNLDNLKGFLCPASSEDALKLMIKHISESLESSFTWTGPFGSGKSSLALLLKALTNHKKSTRDYGLSKISDTNKQLIGDFFCSNSGWKSLSLVGSKSSPENAFRLALKLPESCTTEEIVDKCVEIATSSNTGLIIYIDEMGKYLENQSSKNHDIYFFQLLAEAANRCDGKMIFIGILHQAFSEYARNLTKNIRDEWSKIQGRFVDIPINIASDEQIELIGKAIQSKDKPVTPLGSVITTVTCISKNKRINKKTLINRLSSTWPLHPVTSLLISELSRRRFGQNQRSLFSFLMSAEPNGFKDFLINTRIKSSDLFTPYNLWDYLATNLESALVFSPDAKAWATASDSISKCDNLGANGQHILVLKSIAVISIFKGRSGLEASEELLHSIFNFQIKPILSDLLKWSFIIYKKHSSGYSLYEGSDFDIEESLTQAYERISATDISKINYIANIKPIIAKEHYHRTGALRWLKLSFVQVGSNTHKNILSLSTNNSEIGNIICLLPRSSDEEKQSEQLLKKAHKEASYNLIIGIAHNHSEIMDYIQELTALEWLNDNEPSLAGDSIARREIDSRMTFLSKTLEKSLFITIANTYWMHNGSLGKYKSNEWSGLASQIADKMYHLSPTITNEMLNRDKPSGNANSALKSLLRAMISFENEEHLGIKGFPAERGLYESIIKKNNLHSFSTRGEFKSPSRQNSEELFNLWKSTTKFLKSQSDRVPLVKIFTEWQSPPHGIKKGLTLPLFLSYILSNKAKIAVYIDDTYYPDLDEVFIDYLFGMPKEISIRFVDSNKANESILGEISAILKTYKNSGIKLKANSSPLEISRALVKLITQLNKWVHRTKTLSSDATKLREIIKNADDPNRLLFEDIPSLLANSSENHLKVLIKELTDAYPLLVNSLGSHLFSELGLSIVSEKSIRLLNTKSSNLIGKTGDFRVDALASRLSEFDGTVESITGIASLAANKPISDWIDQDIQRSLQEISYLCHQFNRAELLVKIEGVPIERESINLLIKSANSSEIFNAEIEILSSEQEKIQLMKEKILLSLSDEESDIRLQQATISSLMVDLIEVEVK